MRSIIILACTAAVLATVIASPYSNFSLSCTGITLSHNIFLTATCCRPDDHGVETQLENRLDLSMCIGLDQVTGHLQWEVYGKFSNYCTNCTTLQPTGEINHLLICSCKPLVGGHGPVVSTLNLDDGIANDMGTLTCAGGTASLGHGKGGGDHNQQLVV